MCFACAPVRTVVPLEKNETHISASLGGPLIEFSGAVIPVPLSSVHLGHGLNNSTTFNVAMHTTSLLFGVIQIESSLCKQLYCNEEKKWGISTNPGFYFMIDTWKWKPVFYPMLDVNAYKIYSDNNHVLYLSYSQMIELSPSKAFEQEIQHRYIPWITAGHIWRRQKMNYTIEFKYLNFLQSNENIVVDYIAPGKTGTFGLQLGFTRKF